MLCASCLTKVKNESSTCSHCKQPVLLHNRYLLRCELGSGSFGTVFQAYDKQEERCVAVKEMPYQQARNLKHLELIEREAKVLQRLNHSGIPSYFEHFVLNSGRGQAVYLVEEYIEGISLVDEMEQRTHSEQDVREILTEVATILDYLHRQTPPLVHRDIKPGNLLRRSNHELVLIDFNSARDKGTSATPYGSTMIGTYGYMAPEQFYGSASTATDIYALGVLAVALLSQQDPATLYDHSHTFQWRNATSYSPEMTHLLSQMLEPQTDKRLQDASALQQAMVSPIPETKPAFWSRARWSSYAQIFQRTFQTEHKESTDPYEHLSLQKQANHSTKKLVMKISLCFLPVVLFATLFSRQPTWLLGWLLLLMSNHIYATFSSILIERQIKQLRRSQPSNATISFWEDYDRLEYTEAWLLWVLLGCLAVATVLLFSIPYGRRLSAMLLTLSMIPLAGAGLLQRIVANRLNELSPTRNRTNSYLSST